MSVTGSMNPFARQGWEYKFDPNYLDRGWFESKMGMVVLDRANLEYIAYLFKEGKKYRIGKETFVSAEVGMGVVERVWKREQKS